MIIKYEIVIADPDPDYLQLIAAYVRQTRWAERLNVKWFSKQESLTAEWQSAPNRAQLYLVHRDWIPAIKDPSWVMLDSERGNSSESDDQIQGQKRLFKYQPIEQLLNSAIQAAERQNLESNNGGEGRTRQELPETTVISILSAVGGAGKTTAALHLARVLSAEGKRSLLVNLEPICSLLPTDPEYSRLFGQFLYFSRGGSHKAQPLLSKLIRRHPRIPIDILGGSGAFREIEEMTVADIQYLIEQIKAIGVYSVVILDLDSGISAIVRGAITASDRLVCMMTEDASSIRKTADFLNACPKWLETESEHIRDRLCLVYNGWKGDSGIDSRSLGLKVAAKLPYIPQWKLCPAWEHDQLNPLFERPVFQLAEALQLGRKGLMHTATV